MSKEQKLSTEELAMIDELRRKNQNILIEFGQISISKKNLEEREKEADKKLKEIKSQEQQLVEELRKKYTNGSIDLDRGVYIPADGAQGEEETPLTAFDESVKNK